MVANLSSGMLRFGFRGTWFLFFFIELLGRRTETEMTQLLTGRIAFHVGELLLILFDI